MDIIKELINAGIEEREAKKELSILELEIKDKEKIKRIVKERIKKRIPIQYLIGKTYFMDFELKVDESILIPRPETEILVEETICRCITRNASAILEIGTGSGNIAIALAKTIPGVKITAIDVNKEVIDLSAYNAKINNTEKNINFIICDIFSEDAEKLFKNNKFDLIISNPPYLPVATLCAKSLQPELNHEPKIALYGTKENKTGLIYYERIIELCMSLANQTHTMMAFEIDPPLVKDLKLILKKNNLTDFEIIKDYAKLDRCLFVYL